MLVSRQKHLLLALIVTSYLGLVSGGPIQNERGLVARQETTSAAATTAQTTSHATTTTQRTTQSSATSVASSSVATTSAVSTTAAVTTTAQSSTSTQTTSADASDSSSITSITSDSSESSTTSPTSSSVSATSTSSSNIFNKSSPYFGYAIGVLVVVCIFGSLLLVLIIRFIVQKFSKKPKSPSITDNGAWRYSQDTELYSPGAVPDSANNTVSTAPLARHKGLGAEMAEAQAFLSSESVTLYPPAKYTDEDSNLRRHSRSFSNASSSQATTTPYVQRRPLSFLHSPPATHPAFIVDRDQESTSGHGHSDGVGLKAVSETPRETQSSDATPGPSMANLLLARAGPSDAYRQPTLGSTTMLSREASTASAYSQPSGIHTPPPMPEFPPAPTSAAPQPRPQSRDFSADVAAALSATKSNPSTDTIPGDGLIYPEDNHPTLRPTPGRMGWGRQAPSSIHSHSDLFFEHEQR
ncbi:hypothetical protein OPQ81_007570 [Rhizoctonia solani]|nr:hypothetical protein OPQ81_007570 [Rhizoctonia solani]